MDGTVVGVAAVGMDERTARTLAWALKQHSGGHCALTDASQAQVAVIDLDNADAAMHLPDFRVRHPNVPVIALAKQAPQALDVTHLTKPVAAADLVATIGQLARTDRGPTMDNKITPEKVQRALQAIDAKKAAKALDSRVDDARGRSGALQRNIVTTEAQTHFDPSLFLLGQIQTAMARAKELGKAAVLTCWEDKSIILEPKTSLVSTNLSDTQIRNLAIVPCDGDTTPPIVTHFRDVSNDTVQPDAAHRICTAEVFLWNLGLLTSRGRAPVGTPLNERVYLRRWPNLTRLVLPNNAMRILAYWVRQPCELLSMFEILEVPLEDILSIYSAAHAAGLTGCAKRRADFLIEPAAPPDSDKTRGILSAVLRRLMKQSQTKRKIA